MLGAIFLSGVTHHCCLLCGAPLLGGESLCKRCYQQCKDAVLPISGEHNQQNTITDSTSFQKKEKIRNTPHNGSPGRQIQKVSKSCSRCGLPLISELSLCTGCRRSLPIEGRRNNPLFHYSNLPKELIELYKFQGERSLARLFGEFLYTYRIQEMIEQGVIPTIVPAPPSKEGLKRRGWDQVLEIAVYLHRVYHIPYSPLITRNSHDAVQQKKLNREERLKHTRLLFSVDSKLLAHFLPEHPIILLDDVATTGATLDACYSILAKETGNQITLITLAQL